jgi:hypothetical protein
MKPKYILVDSIHGVGLFPAKTMEPIYKLQRQGLEVFRSFDEALDFAIENSIRGSVRHLEHVEKLKQVKKITGKKSNAKKKQSR